MTTEARQQRRNPTKAELEVARAYCFAYMPLPYLNMPEFMEVAAKIAASFAASSDFSEAGRLLGLQQASEIAEHFKNDVLTPREFPPHGLASLENRADYGMTKKVCEALAAAIREKIAEQEK